MIKTGDYLRGQGDGAGIWEDEDERRFYENLVDLKGRVPAILLEDAKKTKGESNEEDPSGKQDGSDSADKKPSSEADDRSTAIANRTVGAQVDAILLRLTDLQGKDSGRPSGTRLLLRQFESLTQPIDQKHPGSPERTHRLAACSIRV